MPKKPNDQKPQEVSKPESYRKAKPIKGGLAAILLAIAGICGLLATWAGVKDHHTTMTTATIVGAICFAWAGYLHWKPDKEQDERPKKTESPSSKALHKSINSASQSEEQPDWTRYRKDYIQDIFWRWHYKPHTDTRPLDLQPYCYECDPPSELQHCIGPYGLEDNVTWLTCSKHPRQYRIEGNYHRPYASIEKIIQENIRSGKYKEILARQEGKNRLQ